MDKRLTPEEVAGLWPHKCPECGSEAYIGAAEVRCVAHPKVCKNGWLPDHEKFLETLRVIEETSQPMLKFMNLDGTFDDDIDEDAPTNPGIAPFKWFDGLDAKVELALRPYGRAWVERCYDEDAFKVILRNPATGLYLAEKFTVEFAKLMTESTGDRGFGDWLCRHLLDTFPRELSRMWDYKQVEQTFNTIVTDHLADSPDTIQTGAALKSWFDGPHTLQAPKGMTRALQMGQYIMEYRVTGIDRGKDTFTIARPK